MVCCHIANYAEYRKVEGRGTLGLSSLLWLLYNCFIKVVFKVSNLPVTIEPSLVLLPPTAWLRKEPKQKKKYLRFIFGKVFICSKEKYDPLWKKALVMDSHHDD
jgi:hypothetical protein